MKRSFFGGVNPAMHKENTRRKPLAPLDRPPERVVLPLAMSCRGEARAAVKAGDKVQVGQPVALEAEGAGAIHASVSGVVEAVESRPHPWGGAGTAIVIRNDGLDTPWDRPAPPALDVGRIPGNEVIQRIREMGVVGMGGSALPAWEKADAAMGRVDTLIVDAAECEPYATADHRLLLDRGAAVLSGALALGRLVSARETVLLAAGDKLNAVELLERRVRKKGLPIQLRTVRTRYPLGAEKQIIQAVTGREVPPGGSALDVGCVVFNVHTVYAIGQAVLHGRPVTHRAVTVTGGAVVRPRNLWVPIGTPLRCLLESAGGLREERPAAVLTGGTMRGTPQPDLEAPVVKDTNALICLAPWEVAAGRPQEVCLRCGRCAAACPMHLVPAFVHQALRRGRTGELGRLHPQDCIDCGSCAFACPSGIPLVETMRKAGALLERGGEAE